MLYMREVFFLQGQRQRVASIEDALRIVRETYPGAMKQGSVGAWGFYLPPWKDNNIVAEAWLRHQGPGWWLVVKNPMHDKLRVSNAQE